MKIVEIATFVGHHKIHSDGHSIISTSGHP